MEKQGEKEEVAKLMEWTVFISGDYIRLREAIFRV